MSLGDLIPASLANLSRDARLLFLTRFTRLFAYGSLSVILVFYLVGLGLTEAFRGDVLVWLRLDAAGRVARCHLRDASWFQWPLLETAVEGNIVADFPLCNKSFNCSYAGHDV